MKKTLMVLFLVLLSLMLFVSCDNTPKTYKVGDDGPAGGIIFYVNPNAEKDGWTYFEVAKNDLGELVWGPTASNTYPTKTAVGEGKNNTDIFKENGIDSFPAAKACVEYKGGGKSDWFLPSKDELHLIYENLVKDNLISVKTYDYWSSSTDGSKGGYAWSEYLSSGNQSTYTYPWNYYVLPVRCF